MSDHQDNDHLDVFTRGDTYQPPTHDQKRVDQVNRIMERHGNRQKALEDYVDQQFAEVLGG